MLYRRYLPRRQLINVPLPIATVRGPERPCVLLPPAFWPERFVDTWKEVIDE